MIFRVVSLFVLVVGIVGIVGCASDWPQAVPLESDVRRKVVVPMSVDNDVPVVEVAINGSGPFRFMVDTGSAAVIVPRRLADRVKMPEQARGSRLIRTASGTTAAEYRKIESLNLGGALFRGLDATVVGNSQFSGNRWRGIDGIIGLRVFYHMLLTLDYLDGELRIDPAGSLTKDDPGAIEAELIGGQQLTVPVDVGGVVTRFMIDTGASHGVVLTEARLLSQTPVSAGKTVTPTGEVEVQLSRLSVDLKLGPHLLRKPIVAIAPAGMYMYSLDPIAATNEKQRPIIGGEVLRHFEVVIDQKNAIVQLRKPDDKPIDMPPLRDFWLGVETRWESDAIVVIGGGPAPQNFAQQRAREMMDLRVNDRITMVGDTPIAELSRHRLRMILADGNAIPLTVSRSGKTVQSLAPIIDIIGPAGDSPD